MPETTAALKRLFKALCLLLLVPAFYLAIPIAWLGTQFINYVMGMYIDVSGKRDEYQAYLTKEGKHDPFI